MKFKYFFLTLVYLAVGINAFSSQQGKIEYEEEKGRPPQYSYQTHQEQIPQEITPAEELKNTIRGQVQKLIERLQQEEFSEYTNQRGWVQQLAELHDNLDPSKKRILDDVRKKYSQLTTLSLKIRDDLDALPNVMIESKIREYFEGMNIGKVLSIDENQNGVQLKRIVTVQSSLSERPVNWYVKTHAGGLLRETKKSTSKPVDPIELLTYKILEHSGYGTEAHFFYDDERNFYIGTKNVASYSDTQSVRDYPTFLTEDKSQFTQEIMERYPSVEGKGNLIIQGLITADIFSRIFRLTDILTQDGNIVFVNNQDNWHLKIIDFRNRDESFYPSGEELFGGLVCGNGQFNYLGQRDRMMSKYLGTDGLPLRVNFARAFDYQNLRTAVGKAEGEMYHYMNLPKNIPLFMESQNIVYKHSAAIQNIISQFENAARSHSF